MFLNKIILQQILFPEHRWSTQVIFELNNKYSYVYPSSSVYTSSYEGHLGRVSSAETGDQL